jgi:hypothetical protein
MLTLLDGTNTPKTFSRSATWSIGPPASMSAVRRRASARNLSRSADVSWYQCRAARGGLTAVGEEGEVDPLPRRAGTGQGVQLHALRRDMGPEWDLDLGRAA